ncbi:hypothetical protein [Duncaniella muris]|uniref:hypothetical protein n=1 Tax=Duncaniella muris TaxID=2094150 RepID=UPI0025A93B88|nr:hypothetical protein [Duncaniella muris]
MKQHSEKRTEFAVELLLKTLTRNVTDTGIILEEFEATHDDYECDQSKQYDALVAGHFALKEAIDKINNRLNRNNK